MKKDATHGLAVTDSGDHSHSSSLNLRTRPGTRCDSHISVSWPRVQRSLSCTDCGMNEDPIQPCPRLEAAAACNVVQHQWAAIQLHAIHSFFHFLSSSPLPKVV